LAVAAVGFVGCGGGELAGERGGAVVAEYVLVEERGDGGGEDLLADGGADVLWCGGVVAGVVRAVRADVVGVGLAGAAAVADGPDHAPLALVAHHS
jgi:hypothetical protein